MRMLQVMTMLTLATLLAGCGQAPTTGGAADDEAVMSKPYPVTGEREPAVGVVRSEPPAQPRPEPVETIDEAEISSTNQPPRPAPQPVAAPDYGDLQARDGWQAQNWAGPATVQAGKTPLVVNLQAADGKEKVAVQLGGPFNVEPLETITVELTAEGVPELQVAVALITGSNIYQETPRQEVKPGAAATVTFPLNDAKWKSQATEWQHTAALQEPGQVKALALLLYHGGKAGTVKVSKVAIK